MLGTDPLDDLERELGLGSSQVEGQEGTVDRLKWAWVNERMCPAILQYDEALVDAAKEAMAGESAAAGTEAEAIVRDLQEHDRERVQFLLASYLRSRLLKIQRVVMHVLSNQEDTDKLSPAELAFTYAYVDSVADHLNAAFLHSIPQRYQKLDDDKSQPPMIAAPDVDRHVFFEVTQDVGQYLIQSNDVDEVVNLEEGDCILSSYRPFAELLKQNRIRLV